MAEMLVGEFRAVPGGKIIFGPGTAVGRIRGEVDALGKQRALIVTGKTLALHTELVARIKTALGERCAGIFHETAQHVPRPTVLAGAAAAREAGADLLIALGGSTPVDTAKAIALVLAEGTAFDELKVRVEPPDRYIVPALAQPKLPIIAIPTTLSGSEFTTSAGVTDPRRRVKELYRDPKLAAQAIVLDPEMTVATGRELWASTAMKALSDAIEAVCALAHQPYTDALALKAAQMIIGDLPASVEEPLDLAARGHLQYAVWLALTGGAAGGFGLTAALRHQIGAMRNVPHGIASTIVMPHVMGFNRPVAAERLALVAQVAGLTGDGSAAGGAAALIDTVRGLMGRLELPARLRDVGVQREDFAAIATHVLGERAARNNVRPVSEKDQVIQILENAY